jgi:hypothetical protein
MVTRKQKEKGKYKRKLLQVQYPMYPAQKRDKIKETKRIKLGPCGFNRSSTMQKKIRDGTKPRVEL